MFGIYDFLYNAKNDFFFSGHLGDSFLVALVFWDKLIWRTVFLAVSVVFAVSMLFTHMHYSIDIFAAPFITYCIFLMYKWFFKSDFALLHGNHI